MNARLKEEIRQGKPFASREVEAYLNLLRTADALVRGVEDSLKAAGLSQTQYNALRILRGAGPDGLLCGQISERMITRDPDITRMLDRLEARGLVARSRDRKDRRSVTVRITEEGLSLLAKLDAPIADLHRRQLSHLGERNLARLIALLEEARKSVGQRSP